MPQAARPADETASKSQRYGALRQEIAAVVMGEPDGVARMSTTASLLAGAFPEFLWAGFYRVDPLRPDELVVGPYQGSLGCLRIPFGKGVCGAAAQQDRTIVVEDVHAFPGHIACDARARSEIVAPVHDAAGRLIAVLDIDSAVPGAFDEQDAAGLEAIIEAVFGASST